ncbi:MAG: hypothetical protein AAGU21_10415 [Solidesulfovibrio sp.]|uniref:hypothetical protein n=1 Tax=Solidesulfovibrio sp. TaxID=2910990 RepID=UPI002B20D2BD|nr:hypothetical protein [Solidesulfovibrio sp.]MEA4856768.1 hypothetical protein [Solidesulfovibrio sp.]
MTGQETVVPCPCGGYVLTLAPDKPPLGGRAAFTCPACGERRTFTRTETGAVFEERERPAPPEAGPSVAPSAVAAVPPAAESRAAVPPAAESLPEPTPVPPGRRLAMTGLSEGLDPAWGRAVAEAFPPPLWHVLPVADDPRQILADVRFHRPAVILAGQGPAGAALLAAAASLPGRAREAITVLAIGNAPEGDPLAAFRAGADATLARADTAGAAARLADALARRQAQPSLFAAS